MSVDTWNKVLLKNGFNGVDVFCQDSDVTKDQQLSLMISTREEGREKTLSEDIVILEPAQTSETLEAISSELQALFSTKTVSTDRVQWTSDLSICHGKHAIVLMELEWPFLNSLAEQDFLAFKSLVNDAASVLWITRGDDPAMEMIFGLSRTMRNDMSNLKFKVLHIDDQFNLPAKLLAKPIWDIAMSRGPDFEFLFKDGVLSIGRYAEEKDINEMIAGQSRNSQPELMAIGQSTMPLKLEIGMPGMLDTLYFSEDSMSAEPLAPDDVEIRVKASGLK
jgi:hypothetical protein